MRSDGIAVDPPGFNDVGLGQRAEYMIVEAFVAQPSVEGFGKGLTEPIEPAGTS